MTTEVMTDLEVKLADHIKGLIDEYPEIMVEYTDEVEMSETAKTQWFIWHHLQFIRHENVYGVCNECNGAMHVYQITTTKPMPNNVPLTDKWFCIDCAQRYWRAVYVNGYVSRNIPHWRMYPDSLLPEQIGTVPNIDNCNVCQRVMADPSWVNYSLLSSNRHRVYAAFKDGDDALLKEAHAGCTIQCDGCQIYYRGDRYTNTLHSERYRVERIQHQDYCEFCTDLWKLSNPDHTQCSNGCYVSDEDDLRWSDYREESLCIPCYDIDVECNDCGYNYHEDDSHSCDNDDYDSSYPSSEYVHSYSYKPNPNFFGDGEYYMGLELEVEDTNNNYTEGAEVAFTAMNPSRFKKYRGYLKSDGSLSRGFEIVSHPHTLKEFQTNFPWQMLTDLKKLRFRSWNTNTCGLHVHVSRTAFEDDNHQIRFVKLIYDNQRQVQRIAGRTSNYATFSDKGHIIPKVKFKNQSNGRYAAVNVEPEDTIEVRVFRGSLHIPRVLSALEFVDSAVQYTKELKIIPKDKPLSWVRYVGFISANSNRYPNLFDIINRSFDNESPSENVED